VFSNVKGEGKFVRVVA